MNDIITEYPAYFIATNLEWKRLLEPDKYKIIPPLQVFSQIIPKLITLNEKHVERAVAGVSRCTEGI